LPTTFFKSFLDGETKMFAFQDKYRVRAQRMIYYDKYHIYFVSIPSHPVASIFTFLSEETRERNTKTIFLLLFSAANDYTVMYQRNARGVAKTRLEYV
jgi:hypothetical protein